MFGGLGTLRDLTSVQQCISRSGNPVCRRALSPRTPTIPGGHLRSKPYSGTAPFGPIRFDFCKILRREKNYDRTETFQVLNLNTFP